MGYIFSVVDSKLIVTLDTESGRFEENIHEYSEPNLVLGGDRIYLKENGTFVQNFILLNIDEIDGDIPLNLTDAYELLENLIRNLFVVSSGATAVSFKFIQKGFGNSNLAINEIGDIFCGWSNDGTKRINEATWNGGALTDSDNFTPLIQTEI